MMNPKVDFFFNKAGSWQQEYALLRDLLLDTELTEELKWGVPCYTLNKNNVVLIHGFKEYCALLFHKGVLLTDPNGLLIQQTANVQVARQIRFTGVDDIIKKTSILKKLIKEAIEVEKSGKKAVLKTTDEFELVDEFKHKLTEMPALKKAFYALTPGRQRAYLLHFAQPKQAKTREARIEKFIPHILNGKGISDL